jgi:hypothetical protein
MYKMYTFSGISSRDVKPQQEDKNKEKELKDAEARKETAKAALRSIKIDGGKTRRRSSARKQNKSKKHHKKSKKYRKKHHNKKSKKHRKK